MLQWPLLLPCKHGNAYSDCPGPTATGNASIQFRKLDMKVQFDYVCPFDVSHFPKYVLSSSISNDTAILCSCQLRFWKPLFAALCFVGVVFFYSTTIQHLYLSSFGLPSPDFLFPITERSANMVDTPKNPFIGDSVPGWTAEFLPLPSARRTPAANDHVDARSRPLNDGDHGDGSYLASSYARSRTKLAMLMTVPPPPRSPNIRPRKRARMDHGDR